jgi:hypothetical protein
MHVKFLIVHFIFQFIDDEAIDDSDEEEEEEEGGLSIRG